MKRKVKVLLTALFAATTMALTVVASGCSLKDTIKQIGCEHDYGAVATEVLEEPNV